MSKKDFGEEFRKVWSAKLDRVQRVLRKLSRDIGNEAVLFFMEGFRKEQSPTGQKWQARKIPDTGRGLLVKSGRLRKSIRLTRVTQNSVRIGSNVPYAPYHNKGTERLPQRQFLGGSSTLNRRLERMIRRKIMDALKS